MDIIKENFQYVVGVVAIVVLLLIGVFAISNPPTNIIKTHDMDNEVSCYTYAGNIDCLQVVK